MILRHFDSGSSSCTETGGDACKAAYIMVAQEGTAEYGYETYIAEDIVITEELQEQQAELLFYVNDHLNTPQQLLDRAGVVRWSAVYTPFGEARVSANSTVTQNLRFSGQYYDEETGLHYNWNRYYDPELGRYTTSDPIGLAGGLNTYGYAYQNPIRYTDPTGLLPPLAIGGFCVAGAIGPVAGGISQGSSFTEIVAGATLGCAIGTLGGVGAAARASAALARVIAGVTGAAAGGLGATGDALGGSAPDPNTPLPGLGSPDPVDDEVQEIFCELNPNALNCQPKPDPDNCE